MDVTYQKEPFASVRAQASALAEAHWNETEAGMYGARMYTINDAQYEALESQGMLHIFTARSDGALVGYASFLSVFNMHLDGMVATLDGLFVAKAHRGMTGLALLRYAQSVIFDCGAVAVQYSSPASRDCGAIYRRLGAVHTETTYTRMR